MKNLIVVGGLPYYSAMYSPHWLRGNHLRGYTVLIATLPRSTMFAHFPHQHQVNADTTNITKGFSFVRNCFHGYSADISRGVPQKMYLLCVYKQNDFSIFTLSCFKVALVYRRESYMYIAKHLSPVVSIFLSLKTVTAESNLY